MFCSGDGAGWGGGYAVGSRNVHALLCHVGRDQQVVLPCVRV